MTLPDMSEFSFQPWWVILTLSMGLDVYVISCQLRRGKKRWIMKLTYTSFRRQAQIVNRMMSMTTQSRLALPDLFLKLPKGASYSRARPCRIYWRYQGRVPLQIFPKGTIQILGRYATSAMCGEIRDYFITELGLSLSQPQLNSCTVSCRIASRLSHLTSIASNQHVSNEYELFPGTLIRRPTRHRRRGVHLCFFSNGTVIATGVLSRRDAYRHIKHCVKKYRLIQ